MHVSRVIMSPQDWTTRTEKHQILGVPYFSDKPKSGGQSNGSHPWLKGKLGVHFSRSLPQWCPFGNNKYIIHYNTSLGATVHHHDSHLSDMTYDLCDVHVKFPCKTHHFISKRCFPWVSPVFSSTNRCGSCGSSQPRGRICSAASRVKWGPKSQTWHGICKRTVGIDHWKRRKRNPTTVAGWCFQPLWKISVNGKHYPIYYGK